MENLDPNDDGAFVIDGVSYKMADDLKDLPEIDYEDPAVQQWLADEEADRIQKYGKLTHAELDYMYERRPELQKEFPQKTVVELNQMALKEFRDAKR